jgi:DNA-binding response OmpR family regulator
MQRILVAEDEPRLASSLETGLKATGFSVVTVRSGASAIAVARDADFDLLVLDLDLPDMGGTQVLRRIRERGHRLPVIILSARHEVERAVAGLEGGANDYLTKPFAFEDLLARLRVLLETTTRSEQVVIEAAGLELDLLNRRVVAGGRPIELSPQECRLAEVLMRHQGEVLSREQLLSWAWGYDFDPRSNIVDVYIGYLRKKLGRDVIETVWGKGFRFRAAPE